MQQSQVTVSTTPTLIFSGTGKIRIQNNANAGELIYLGGASVSAADGFKVVPSSTREEIVLELAAPTDVYAIANTGTRDVRVLHWY